MIYTYIGDFIYTQSSWLYEEASITPLVSRWVSQIVEFCCVTRVGRVFLEDTSLCLRHSLTHDYNNSWHNCIGAISECETCHNQTDPTFHLWPSPGLHLCYIHLICRNQFSKQPRDRSYYSYSLNKEMESWEGKELPKFTKLASIRTRTWMCLLVMVSLFNVELVLLLLYCIADMNTFWGRPNKMSLAS